MRGYYTPSVTSVKLYGAAISHYCCAQIAEKKSHSKKRCLCDVTLNSSSPFPGALHWVIVGCKLKIYTWFHLN